MPLRPSLFSRWLVQPAELLQQSTLRQARASLTQTLRPSEQLATRTIRRPFASAASRTTRTRPALRAVQLPRRTGRRYNSSTSNSTQAPKEGNSLSQRLRTLSREYGWAALGVYLGLSALDFPFCFVAVRLLGVERIGHWEHVVVQYVKDTFHTIWPQKEDSPGEGDEEDGALVRAEEANQEEASLWTQLVLAYAIHKSFIFIRVPLTAAVTPKVVKMLRRWGWDIGKRKPKST
ncbi:uncharacterized protein N7482_002303 [Penicillium canariense]|uniref:DUF1279 domain-containing protein n=1 Tax=Penicillium canariense TaxID=189055 RepID=A0A9W9ILI6_9EURO|nr:uncharacterized protein N7482_002303 [Penicillium canariense]KAJ5176426.1 hypothetical protein N7482_002303 [Penicillium canariense]